MKNLNKETLLQWFDDNKKDFPWGRKKTPYLVWISEIMLQQTVAATVIPYFVRWSKDYPDIQTLAGSDLNDVLGHWEGLGYYSRCRNIHKASQYLMDKHKGVIPDSYKELTAVPGIGDYTARAILSIAFNQPYAVLDANVRRIIQRLQADPDWTSEKDRISMEELEMIIPADRPGDFNEAMMQFGQLICTTGSPKCDICPLSENCLARIEGIAGNIPLKKSKKIKVSEKTVIVIYSHGKLLLRRKKKGLFHDMWILPTAEADSCAKVEWLNNEWSNVSGKLLKKRNHFYTDNKDALTPCLVTSDEIDLSCMTPEDDEMFEYRWIEISRIDDYPTPSVYRKILDEVKEQF